MNISFCASGGKANARPGRTPRWGTALQITANHLNCKKFILDAGASFMIQVFHGWICLRGPTGRPILKSPGPRWPVL